MANEKGRNLLYYCSLSPAARAMLCRKAQLLWSETRGLGRLCSRRTFLSIKVVRAEREKLRAPFSSQKKGLHLCRAAAGKFCITDVFLRINCASFSERIYDVFQAPLPSPSLRLAGRQNLLPRRRRRRPLFVQSALTTQKWLVMVLGGGGGGWARRRGWRLLLLLLPTTLLLCPPPRVESLSLFLSERAPAVKKIMPPGWIYYEDVPHVHRVTKADNSHVM